MNPTFKKILLIILFGCGFYLIDQYDGIQTTIRNVRISYSFPLLAFCSVIYGPVVGGCAGLLGQVIVQTGELVPDWFAVIATVLYCVMIGLFCRKIDIGNGFFSRQDATFFNKVHIGASVIIFQFFYPLLNIIFNKIGIRDALTQGAIVSIDIVIGCMLLATMFLALYAKTRISAANFYRS